MISRFPLLRALCALCALCVNSFFLFSSASQAQNLDKPLQSIDEEITAFAYAPDGRIVYSVYRRVKTKVYDALEHDDIWLQDANGKRRRLLEGQKYTRGNQSFSYLIDSFRWSPNGHFILAQLLTTTVLDDAGKTEDSFQTMLFDDSGKEIHINKGDNVILDAANPFFLPDNATIAFLSEAVKPRLLFSLKFTRPATGALLSFYEGRTFREVAWLPGVNSAIAVSPQGGLTCPSRLQRLKLVTNNEKAVSTFDSYAGALGWSHSGNSVAYF